MAGRRLPRVQQSFQPGLAQRPRDRTGRAGTGPAAGGPAGQEGLSPRGDAGARVWRLPQLAGCRAGLRPPRQSHGQRGAGEVTDAARAALPQQGCAGSRNGARETSGSSRAKAEPCTRREQPGGRGRPGSANMGAGSTPSTSPQRTPSTSPRRTPATPTVSDGISPTSTRALPPGTRAAAWDARCLAELAALTSSSRAYGNRSAAEEGDGEGSAPRARVLRGRVGEAQARVPARCQQSGGVRGCAGFGWERVHFLRSSGYGAAFLDLCWQRR